MILFKQNSRAFAIPTVLGLALFLSIMAVTLLSQFSGQIPMSDMKYDRLRAHFLAVGGIQLALLKIKHLPREFYSSLINYDAYNKMSVADQMINKNYKSAYHAFIDVNFHWETPDQADNFEYFIGSTNKYYFGQNSNIGYYNSSKDKEDYIKLISIEPMGTRPMLETGIDTGYFEDDLFKVKFRGHTNGIIEDVTQTIKLTRQVILN